MILMMIKQNLMRRAQHLSVSRSQNDYFVTLTLSETRPLFFNKSILRQFLNRIRRSEKKFPQFPIQLRHTREKK